MKEADPRAHAVRGLMTGPARSEITGLVLAGGRGQRMGGVDKGLQPWRGRPLVDHALAGLAPQVASLLISANRNVADYARRGVPVLVDGDGDFDGPLAGILAGLRRSTTPWLAVVPCDAPRLPADLVARLAQAIAAAGPGTAGAFVQRREAATARWHAEPVCALLSVTLAPAVAAFLAGGGRKVEAFHDRPGIVRAGFERAGDDAAFANFNRPEELREDAGRPR